MAREHSGACSLDSAQPPTTDEPTDVRAARRTWKPGTTGFPAQRAQGGTAVEQSDKALARLKIMRLIEKKRRARYEKRYVKKTAVARKAG